MKLSIIYIYTAITLIAISACGHKHEEGDGHDHGTEETESHGADDGHDHGETEAHGEDEGIFLTQEQMETIGLEFGSTSSLKVNDYVQATGTLGLPPNAYSSVTAKIEGIINGNKKFVEGNYIKKGTVIAYIENPLLITKQQEYLETKAQYNYSKLELERQKKLNSANAGVNKTLEQAQSQFYIVEAKYMGLKKQLQYYGINVSKLTSTTIADKVYITAPMSGYITKINMHNGMHALNSFSLMEIVSSSHLHLELDVFENNIASVKEGQKITYTIPALGNKIFNGEVSVIGREFNSEGKSVRVHGHLEGEKPRFIKDLFIQANIWLNDNVENALPEEAIIKEGQNSFIFVGTNTKESKGIDFEKIRVLTGATQNGYTSVKFLDKIPEGKEIVLKGAFFVYAQSMAGELEHEH